ncbi:amidohydrolase family protein [Flavobacteriaceae bacterium S356]|uniref:Amidohydrolase family protein n=1 Tax=Asprobacillus argus TaxID=3076534 RepID=A0ABU3LBI0_9FLAO|nr:amidohydrolase family protein [Flavobacteriaceae bacterium S356]
MKHLFKTVIAALTCIIITSCKNSDEQSILLKDPTIIDVSNGQLYTNSILIENGVIKEMGDYNELAKKTATQVVDCTGKYVIPGLFDMHMHLVEKENSIPELHRLLKSGITGIRDMGGIADTVAQAKKMIRNGDLLGPDIYFAGYTLDGTQTNDPFHLKVHDTTDIKKLVSNLEAIGIDFLKVHNYFPTHKLVELKKAGNEIGIKIAGHIPVGIGLFELDSVGIKCIEHINSLISSIVLKKANGVNNLNEGLHALDSTYISKLSTYFKKNGIALTPTLYAMNDMYANLEGEAARAKGLRMMRVFNNIIRWMAHNEVLLLAGTDRGILNDNNIYELQDELGILVASGLSPLQALKTATINPAKFLNIDTAYGSVEIGKKANLIILNSNPLLDISHTKDIHTVLKEGKLFRDS